MQEKEQMTSSNFTIRFIGESVKEGEMNAKNLGNAIIDTDNLIKSVNKVIGNKSEVDIVVKGTGKGSFELYFEVASRIAEQLSMLPIEDTPQFLLDKLLEKGNGLIDFINSSGGEYPENDEEISDEIQSLFVDRATRRVLRKLLRGLFIGSRIEKLCFSRQGYEDIEVEKNDLENFKEKMKDDDDPYSRDVLLEIITLSFKENGKWSVKEEGGKPFNVEITAPDFLKDINNNEKFSKNDYLFCKLLEEKVDKDGKIVERKAITEVYEHILAEEQAEMLDKE